MGEHYWSAPTADELDGLAYTKEDFPEPEVEVWDENWDVIHLFKLYARQWRVAMNGPVGLDMTVFHHALDRKGVVGEDYDDWVSDLRIVEAAALNCIHSK